MSRAQRALVYGTVGVAMEVVFTGVAQAFHRDRADWKLQGHSYLWMLPLYGALTAYAYEPVRDSLRNRPVGESTAVFGEIGLAGEVRGITQAALRVREAAQLGFKRCILPRANIDPADRTLADGGCELTGVSTVAEALDALLV